MRRRRSTRPASEIITKPNVVPIIDVSLVLVIILLVTAPMITATDLRIQLPEAHTRAAEDERNLSVTLGPDGDVKVDRDVVPRRRLVEALRNRLAESPDELVVVCADAGASYEQVEALLEDARKAGARRLAIATRHKKDTR
jgi:biopolymer transport protein ExbD